jgi:hypothetical protein
VYTSLQARILGGSVRALLGLAQAVAVMERAHASTSLASSHAAPVSSAAGLLIHALMCQQVPIQTVIVPVRSVRAPAILATVLGPARISLVSSPAALASSAAVLVIPALMLLRVRILMAIVRDLSGRALLIPAMVRVPVRICPSGSSRAGRASTVLV